MSRPFLVYGSYGYTGALVVRYALEQGLRPVLGGRNRGKLEAQAAELGLEYRVFGLEEAGALDAGLEGMCMAAHCAGPFSRTAASMAEACLRTGTHYLDITGEIDVFEGLAALDRRACEAGIMLLPGSGFDVVPSDCLAAHLHQQLPSATRLTLAIHSDGRPSHGTAATIVENFFHGGRVRRDGVIVEVPGAWKIREIDFGQGRQKAMTIPWGDVSTAYYSTGIPNIEVYMSAPLGLRLFMRGLRFVAPLLRGAAVQRFLQARIPEGGPSDEARAKGYCLLWGEVVDDAGGRAEACLRTPDGYTLTAQAVVRVIEKILDGVAPPGFKTPSLAYGPEFVLELPGTRFMD